MKQEKQDRRSLRTRHLVSAAMLELMRGKRYDAITVQDLLDRSGIGRSTFYAHFFDKEDVLKSVSEQMLETFRHQLSLRNIERTLATTFAEKSSPSVPPTVVSQYLAGAFLSLLRWWIEAEMPYSPGRMDEIFQQLALPGVWTLIKGKSE
jgi:AcrR family transcriptional regulator